MCQTWSKRHCGTDMTMQQAHWCLSETSDRSRKMDSELYGVIYQIQELIDWHRQMDNDPYYSKKA